ncbi:uncharacterized protein LOC143793619 [Ranitomeya variabilis]|uniref:uncharacterized protein LOC143793619 n=1 Tax=Ranitomeya variabilis TaxID=490064 RepID=UPI004056F7CE
MSESEQQVMQEAVQRSPEQAQVQRRLHPQQQRKGNSSSVQRSSSGRSESQRSRGSAKTTRPATIPADTVTRPETGRKSTAKTKHRECAICSDELPSSWEKRLCSVCIKKTIQEETPSFASELKSLIKSQVESAIKGIKATKKKHKKTPESPVSSADESESELSDSNNSSDSDTSSVSSEGGRSCFPIEETDALVKAVRATMGLVEERPKKTAQDIMFSGLEQKRKRAFPVNEKIHSLIKREWKKPDKKALLTPKRKYPFDDPACSSWSKAPKLDVAIAKASKKFALPFEDMGTLKDPMDKKAEVFLKNSWEAAGGGLKPAVAATCTARALMVWLEHLDSQLKGKVSRDTIQKSVSVMKGAAAFLADASVDSARLAARAAAFSNAARRALWLKCWPGDLQTKTKLCSIPCEGEFLFGTTLDDILEKAEDKKKSFPGPPTVIVSGETVPILQQLLTKEEFAIARDGT